MFIWKSWNSLYNNSHEGFYSTLQLECLMTLTFFYVNFDSYFPNTMTLNYLEKRMYRWVIRYMVPLCLSHCYLSTSEFQYLSHMIIIMILTIMPKRTTLQVKILPFLSGFEFFRTQARMWVTREPETTTTTVKVLIALAKVKV